MTFSVPSSAFPHNSIKTNKSPKKHPEETQQGEHLVPHQGRVKLPLKDERGACRLLLVVALQNSLKEPLSLGLNMSTFQRAWGSLQSVQGLRDLLKELQTHFPVWTRFSLLKNPRHFHGFQPWHQKKKTEPSQLLHTRTEPRPDPAVLPSEEHQAGFHTERPKERGLHIKPTGFSVPSLFKMNQLHLLRLQSST